VSGQAAEGFAYDLKTHKRAILIGETTAGYAHPGSNVRINEHFSVIVPQGRVINSVTKTDWEGTGVRPDIEVTAPLALKTAHVAALKKALQKEIAEERKKNVRAALVAAQKELDELKNK
jgi:C-terminal processing protease CtpA/Prc